MIDLSRRSARALGLVLATTILVACAGAPSSPAPSGSANASGPSAAHGPEATPRPTPSPSSVGPAAIDPATPTGCIGLGPQDCERARALAATVLEAADPRVVYVQVGPFRCKQGDRCPTNLLVRPQGDVVIEFGGGKGINVQLTVAADGSFQATRGEAMGIGVPPASPPDGLAGPREFTLGHCGIFSGIDVDASYWDPVGPISFDSGEAINATTGILSLTDPDHGLFTAPAGFSVQLVRHEGPKLLPLCM